MLTKPSSYMAYRIVFIVCVIVVVFLFGYFVGYVRGKSAPKECAKVEGMKPISSTADECTYIQARGLAYYRRMAL